jgi:epoxyqueuosine reductase
MDYLGGHRASLRTDPRSLLPSARSVICLAKVYKTGPEPASPWISRYAQAADYHDSLRSACERLVAELRSVAGDFDYRICVDTAPLLERSYARLAGIGWIGRNTCLINEQLGSWLFLAEILTSLDLDPGVPAPDRCGTCTRCIDACPTAAIQPGGMRTELDATRCISYFTIELKGAIPEDARDGVGEHVFGCDICQDVCPWNSKAPDTSDPAFAAVVPGTSLDDLAAMPADEFRTAFRHTPVWRTKHSGFLRNVAVAMGNSRDPRYRPALERLASSPDEVVAEHALWALARID